VYRNNGEIIKNAPRELISDLDSLPMPAWHLLPVEKYMVSPPEERYSGVTGHGISICTCRGCPYNCLFCASHSVFQGYRYRSAMKIVKEIEYFVNVQGIRNFFIVDEVFTFDLERLRQFCNLLIEKNLDITWAVNSKVVDLSTEILKLMKRAGCQRIDLGVESGNKQVIKNIRKGINVKTVKILNTMIHNVGLQTTTLMMFGNPGEGYNELIDSLNLIADIETEYPEFAITTPFPGTELYNLARKNGWLRTDDWDEYEVLNPYPVMRNEFFSHNEIRNISVFITIFCFLVGSCVRYKRETGNKNFVDIYFFYRELFSKIFNEQGHDNIDELRITSILLAYIRRKRSSQRFNTFLLKQIKFSQSATNLRYVNIDKNINLFKNVKKILILRVSYHRHISLILSKIEAMFPEAKVDLVCQKNFKSIYEKDERINDIIVIDPGYFRFWKNLLFLAPRISKGYDLIVVPYNNEAQATYFKINLFISILPLKRWRKIGLTPRLDMCQVSIKYNPGNVLKRVFNSLLLPFYILFLTIITKIHKTFENSVTLTTC
ncbi:MAG: radical SAM protein, partial [Candidatus Hydrogenedentota bacterium]